MKLGILNTSILTVEGIYKLENITLEQAKELVSTSILDSAIGHQSTADIMTELLGVEIPLNRQMFIQEKGQKALVFKLNSRLEEEKKILTVDEIKNLGYKFQLITRIE